MHDIEGTPRAVILRDLALLYIKLGLDGLKDLMLIWLAGFAAAADLLTRGPGRGKYFYAVLRLGERIDLWLNVYGPSKHAALNPDGLFGESRAGDDTYMGRVEELLRREEARPAAHR
jgi:hypothetical protein